MNTEALLWLAIAATILGCVAATAVRALRDFSRHELEQLSQRCERPQRFADILRNHERIALGVDGQLDGMFDGARREGSPSQADEDSFDHAM